MSYANQSGVSRRRKMWLVRLALVCIPVSDVCAASPCLPCHAKEVAGYEQTAMARSLSRSAHQPSGSFTHAFSGTEFSVRPAGDTIQITMKRAGLSATYQADYVVGSGSHAFGYLVRINDYLFQAPISYYVKRGKWDMAPGYESDPEPDFSRPVSAECVECHAGHPRPVKDTLNRYETPAFSVETISCDRCHGDPAAHLRQPSRQNIVNPQRLPARARDSICEQCHLTGETRVLNPGRQFGDFQPGRELEEVFSVYVRDASDPALLKGPIKVISHAEQLALSACARKSAGKLWCGTCHNPHEQPENSAKYYRERCLSCHGNTILQTHALPAGDCISCHMTRRKAKDGAHTVFTDHRIARIPQAADDNSSATPPVGKLVAWHEPPGSLAVRNLGLANIEIGERDHSAEHMEEGARQVVAAMKVLPPDPAMLTKVGLVFLRKGEASDAIDVFEYTLGLDPSRAGSYANLGNAYKEAGQTDKAVSELERAIQLDPSLEIAYRSLAEIFAKVKDQDKVRAIYKRYLQFMPESVAMREALIRYGAR
jgi:hypothetical protein